MTLCPSTYIKIPFTIDLIFVSLNSGGRSLWTCKHASLCATSHEARGVCSFTKKVEGAEAGLRELRGDNNAQSTIKIFINALFSPDITHFSIKVAWAPD